MVMLSGLQNDKIILALEIIFHVASSTWSSLWYIHT